MSIWWYRGSPLTLISVFQPVLPASSHGVEVLSAEDLEPSSRDYMRVYVNIHLTHLSSLKVITTCKAVNSQKPS